MIWQNLGGYSGKILHIDLRKRKVVKKKLNVEVVKKFIGGRGLGAHILYHGIKPKTDPFSPDNLLIFATGPLTGTMILGSRIEVISKSPLTGGYADSSMGAHIGKEIKAAGYDAFVIRGKSDNPSYVFIDDDAIEIRDASHLWGKGSLTTEKQLKDEIGDETIQVASIGIAGENLVKFACITTDYGRQAGRCGLGSVMGSKKLKAVAVRGTKDIKLANPASFQEIAEEVYEDLKKNPDICGPRGLRKGTSRNMDLHQEWGALPTRNFQTGVFEEIDGILGETVLKRVAIANKACTGCMAGCGKWSMVKEGPYAGTVVEGPEYETLALLGSNCGIGDVRTIARANYLCDDLGLDTISAGNVIGFAMECFERGIITKQDTADLELRFGNEEAYLRTIELIANREGIGAILAEGVKKAAEKFGKRSEKFAMHSHGLEWSGYECRGSPGQALAYSLVDRGADHNRIWTGAFFSGSDRYSIERKPEECFRLQLYRSSPDIMGTCRFISYFIKFDYYPKMLTSITGIDFTESDILQTAERVWNLTRVFNFRERGFTRKDDSIPARNFEEPVPSGPTKGRLLKREEFERMLDRFYEISEWDKETGIPTQEKLAKLGLRDIGEELKKLQQH